MDKKWQCLLILFSAFMLNMMSTAEASAENRLLDLRIDIQLNEDGSVDVTEYRQTDMDEGTELYILMDNLQESELLDFYVTGFDENTDWDSSDSQAEKSGQYGIIETSDGLELVWGIGDYGQNNYEVHYSLSDVVRQLEDGQSLLWNFDTFSDIPAEQLVIELSGPQPFSQENTKLWGFGFNGDMTIENGKIVWLANEQVGNRQNAIVLLQFQDGMFNPQVTEAMTLAEQEEMAKEGSAYNIENKSRSNDKIAFGIVGTMLAGGAITIGVILRHIFKVKKIKEEAGDMISGSKRIQKNSGLLYDKVPFEDRDYPGLAYLLNQFATGYFENYFSVFILEWVIEGKIDMVAREEKGVFKDKVKTDIVIHNFEEARKKEGRSFASFVDDIMADSSKERYETGMWLMLLEAADRTGLVRDTAIQRWANDNANDVETFADFLTEYSMHYLEEQSLIQFDEVQAGRLRIPIAIASPEGDLLFDQLIQFYNYLSQQTKLDKLEQVNVSMDDYLIWNSLYNKNDELTKEFKNFVPKPSESYNHDSYDHYYWYWHGTRGFNQSWSQGLSSGGFHSSQSADYGGGGSTSIGGGGGAGGGGGGGAR